MCSRVDPWATRTISSVVWVESETRRYGFVEFPYTLMNVSDGVCVNYTSKVGVYESGINSSFSFNYTFECICLCIETNQTCLVSIRYSSWSLSRNTFWKGLHQNYCQTSFHQRRASILVLIFPDHVVFGISGMVIPEFVDDVCVWSWEWDFRLEVTNENNTCSV